MRFDQYPTSPSSADADKALTWSTANNRVEQTRIEDIREPLVRKTSLGASNGVAELGGDGKVPNGQLKDASESVKGINQNATNAEVQAGTGSKSVVVSALAAWWTHVKTLAQTFTGNITLGSSSGNAHTINGTITANHQVQIPNAVFGANNALTGAVGDNRFVRHAMNVRSRDLTHAKFHSSVVGGASAVAQVASLAAGSQLQLSIDAASGSHAAASFQTGQRNTSGITELVTGTDFGFLLHMAGNSFIPQSEDVILRCYVGGTAVPSPTTRSIGVELQRLPSALPRIRLAWHDGTYQVGPWFTITVDSYFGVVWKSGTLHLVTIATGASNGMSHGAITSIASQSFAAGALGSSSIIVCGAATATLSGTTSISFNNGPLILSGTIPL